MRMTFHPSCISVIALLVGSAADAQEFSPQRPRDAVRTAKSFLAGLESPGKCPARVEADPEHAAGVGIRPQTLPFFLFVPQKDLEKADFQGKEVHQGYGVPVGYLFTFLAWMPVVDGQLVDRGRMQNAVYEDPKAGRLDINCLVLTASRKEDTRYVLQAFGTGSQPLFSVPLEKAGKKLGNSIEVKDVDVQALRMKLELSFGAGWRASMPFGSPHQPGR